MMVWWKELSRREKMLISAMGGIAAVILFITLVIRPLGNFRENANQNLVSAQSTSMLVNQAIAANGSGQAQSTDNLRGVITSSAQRYGLRWINIRTNQEDMSLTISFSGVMTNELFPWLIDLQEKNRIIVKEARVSDTRYGEGRVEASITFVQGA